MIQFVFDLKMSQVSSNSIPRKKNVSNICWRKNELKNSNFVGSFSYFFFVLSMCSPCFSTTNLQRCNRFAQTRKNRPVSPRISSKALLIRSFKPRIVVSLTSLKTLSFKLPQRNKYSGVRSGDLGGQLTANLLPQ